MAEWFCKKCHGVVHTNKFTCCGETVIFDPQEHGRDLISGSNSWRSVWEQWKDDETVRLIAAEHAECGNSSAANILNDAIRTMKKDNTDYRATVAAALAGLRAAIEAHDARNPDMPDHSTALAWAAEELDATIAALGLPAAGTEGR